MSNDASRDKDIEGLVEKQARGEPAGVPEEATSSGAGQLDTRRSKSGLVPGTLFGQTHVDIPGAEVDSQSYIAQQTGIIVDGVAPDASIHPAVASQPPVPMAGGEVDTAYPDVVDRPEYIEAHMRPGVVDVPQAEADTQSTILAQGGAAIQYDTATPQVAEVTPSQAALDANQYPDAVDRPEFIQAHAVVRDDTSLAELRTPETEIQIGPSKPG
jgi:hypothetical protein